MTEEIKKVFDKVEGWFDFEKLYERIVNETNSKAHFVEVGSYQGKSAFYIADLIRESKKKIDFDCVDFWQTQEEYQIFLNNIIAGDLTNFVYPIKSDSAEAVKLYKDKSLDFVFIDADHSYESCSKDIDAWLPKIKIGGYLSGHDYEHWGVKKAVDEHFNEIELIKSSWLVKIK